MNEERIEQFPYILDEWDRLVRENPDDRFVFDSISTHGRIRADVDEAASKIYAYLKKNNIGKEDFVMICMPRYGHVIPAILGVLKAGAAFTVVDGHYAEDRIEYIYNDCKCKLKIDLDMWKEAMLSEEPLSGYEPTDEHDACFAVYTSGSTGNPKGVVHEYGKLKMIQLTAIQPYADVWNKEECRFGLIPPLNFVAALKFIVYGIYTGMKLYIIPTETIKNPKKLKQYFLDYKITDCHMAPSVIRAAGDDFGPYLKRVITGSEPPNGVSFDNASLINNYTMSESAFVVSQYEINEKEDKVPIGKPNFDEIKIHLLNEDGEEVEDGEVGEICFENIYFRKYNNMPEETEEALRGGLYHTGDLGKKLDDGNYIIAGRMNDMIKINGNRVEPAEIERHAKEILGIDWCVAKGFIDNDKAFLCLYYTEDIEFDVIEVKEKLGEMLPYYMVPAYYIKINEIPLLPNNKIDKKALPKPDTTCYRAEYVAPRNELETKLCKGFEEVLDIDKVGIRDDFFELGGDSLSVMRLTSYLNWEQLSSTDIYTGITAERIAAIYIKKISALSAMTPEEYEMDARSKPHHLTPTQVFMLDSSLFKPVNNTWNLPTLFCIEDKNSIEKMVDAVNEVIRQTPICSTMIYFDEDYTLMQRYVPEKCPVVEIEHVTDAEFEELKNTGFGSHTDIIDNYLYQFRIFETESCGYLYINRHHIATDGMSKSLLFGRIVDTFEGKEIPLDTYYTTIQRWEDEIENGDFEGDEKYFLDRYGDIEWTRQLDFDDDSKDITTGMTMIPVQVTQDGVSDFEKTTGVTRNQLFNICMILAMAKCTGKKDVMMHYTFHNRKDSASNEAIGGLYTVLPLGLRLGNYRNLTELYDDVKAQAIGNAQHGNHDWSELLNPGQLQNDFSVSYETDEILGSSHTFTAIGVKEVDLPHDESLVAVNRFACLVLDTPAGFSMVAIYQSNHYSNDTANKFMNYYDAFLSALVNADNPNDVDVAELVDNMDISKPDSSAESLSEGASVMSFLGDSDEE